MPNPATIDLTARRLAAKRAELLARIAATIPEREDYREHPGGHVWRRLPHAEVAVRAAARRAIV